MKREKINKEDVFEQYGWKPEDGDYLIHHHRPNNSKFKRFLRKISSFLKKSTGKKHKAKQYLLAIIFCPEIIACSDYFSLI